MQYPSAHTTGLQPYTGNTYTYGYDTMGRPNRMTDTGTATDIVTGLQYNGLAGELTQISYGDVTESRSYNTLGQLTGLSAGGYMNLTYTYSATQNNGRIMQMTDAISGGAGELHV